MKPKIHKSMSIKPLPKLEEENERLKQKIWDLTKDLASAKRCIDFQCIRCNNKRCINYRCPLNDNT